MAKKLYVGNLVYGTDDAALAQLFEQFGTVVSAQIILDRDTGRSKGFGFVEMESEAQAQAAVDTLNGKEVEGRTLTVNEARPKEERPAVAAPVDAAAMATVAGAIDAAVVRYLLASGTVERYAHHWSTGSAPGATFHREQSPCNP